jgi:hypothetical protein
MGFNSAFKGLTMVICGFGYDLRNYMKWSTTEKDDNHRVKNFAPCAERDSSLQYLQEQTTGAYPAPRPFRGLLFIYSQIQYSNLSFSRI